MAAKEEIAVSDLPPALAALGALLARLDALHGRERVAAAAGPALAEAAAAAAARAEAASVAAALDDATEGEAAEAQRAAEEAGAAQRDNGRLRGALAVAIGQLESEVIATLPAAVDAHGAWCERQAATALRTYQRAAWATMAAAREIAEWRAVAGRPMGWDAVALPADPLGDVHGARIRPEDAPTPTSRDLSAALEAAALLHDAGRIRDRQERRAA